MSGIIIRANIPYSNDAVVHFDGLRTKQETRAMIGKTAVYESFQTKKIKRFRGKVIGIYGSGFGTLKINFGFRLGKNALGREVNIKGV